MYDFGGEADLGELLVMLMVVVVKTNPSSS